MLVMLVVAAAGYRFFGGTKVTNLEAIYMAVITISTVGYNEIVDSRGNPPLRIFFGSTGLPIVRSEYRKRIDNWDKWNALSVEAEGNMAQKQTPG